MKITKRQLRRIIREEKQNLITESRVRRLVRRKLMVELFGFLKGKFDTKGFWALSDLAEEIAKGESEIKTGEQAAPRAKQRLARALTKYAELLEKADELLYKDHLDHPGLKRVRASSGMMKHLASAQTGFEAAEIAREYAAKVGR